MDWLRDAAAAIPQLGPPDQWPACLPSAGLIPLRLAQGVERESLDQFVYCLHGMYPAVLAARMAAGRGDKAGHGDSLFPDQPRPRPRHSFPGTTSSTPSRGMQSATSRASGRGPRRAGGGPRSLSRIWSGGRGR